MSYELLLLAQFVYCYLSLSPVISSTTTATAVISAVSTTTRTWTSRLISSFITWPAVSPVTYIALTTNEIWIKVSFRKYFTFTDPYFDTDLSVNCQGKQRDRKSTRLNS